MRLTFSNSSNEWTLMEAGAWKFLFNLFFNTLGCDVSPECLHYLMKKLKIINLKNYQSRARRTVIIALAPIGGNTKADIQNLFHSIDFDWSEGVG